MKVFWIMIFGMATLLGPPSQSNLAREAMMNGDYPKAVDHYKKALEENRNESAAIHYNLALAYSRLDSFSAALTHYSQSFRKKGDRTASWAFNNFGVIQSDSNQLDKALDAMKNALRADPTNETARYNYELLKRRKHNQEKNNPPPPEDNQNNPENPPPPENNSPKNRPTPKPPKENSGETSEGNISMERARQLLDAMNQNERQFLQELRKSKKVKSRNSSGPDW